MCSCEIWVWGFLLLIFDPALLPATVHVLRFNSIPYPANLSQKSKISWSWSMMQPDYQEASKFPKISHSQNINRISSSHAQWLKCRDTSHTWYYLNRHATLLPGVMIRPSFRHDQSWKKAPWPIWHGIKSVFLSFFNNDCYLQLLKPSKHSVYQ